ncbi:hypothetical protein DFQ28_004681 [Apophysomyces sp. BC1034]|nr:hypothetical protein DFQ29_009365 [Apophysomyces sp. BC1021]KAG0193561.1 hypothetical protein DFQ28_004681 [Apophysomyces sp. BC1034]
MDDDDEDMTDNDSDEDEESSDASADAEERAYLREIQQTAIAPAQSISPISRSDIRPMAASPSSVRRLGMRAPSVASTQSGQLSMVTAPTRRPSGTSSVTMASVGTSSLRPPSAASGRSVHDRRSYLTAQRERAGLRGLPREPFLEEQYDDSVNPWAQHPSSRRYKLNDGHSITDDSDDNDHNETRTRRTSTLSAQQKQVALSPQMTEQSASRFQSPIFSSTSSSATATARTAVPRMSLNDFSLLQQQQQHQQQQRRLQHPENRLLSNQQYTSVVALGPATKRALEALQSEIVALNERIDGLRQELVDRDQRRSISRQPCPSGSLSDDRSGEEDGAWEGWQWVFKAAAKHAAIHLLTAFILFLVLYQRGSPVAYVILGQVHKYWLRIKLRLRISKPVA